MFPELDSTETAPRSRARDIFGAFLKLGLTSFGGPIAHLGYFRTEFVERRKWLSEGAYADLVALCQFLPGPASSQVGIGLGLLRGGLPGAFVAWLGFTLPSAVALVLFAMLLSSAGLDDAESWLHGLKVVAVAVVAQALWGMGKSLCPDRSRASVAVVGAVLASWVPGVWGQVGVIVAGPGGCVMASPHNRLAAQPVPGPAAQANRACRSRSLCSASAGLADASHAQRQLQSAVV